MFIVLLRLSENIAKVNELMEAHNAWIQRGFADGVFLLVGTLQPKQGGAILASAGTRAELEARVNDDPFVRERVVQAELLEVSPSRTDERLQFLLG